MTCHAKGYHFVPLSSPNLISAAHLFSSADATPAVGAALQTKEPTAAELKAEKAAANKERLAAQKAARAAQQAAVEAAAAAK